MQIKTQYQLPKPSGDYVVGSRALAYEYTAASGEARVLPCLCWYPASGRGNGILKKYANEQIVPGTGGIVTNAFVNAPVAEGKHPLVLFNHGFSLGLESNSVQCEELASHGYMVLSVGHPGDGAYELPDGTVMLFDVAAAMEKFKDEAAAGMDIWTPYQRWLEGEGKTATLDEHRARYQGVIGRQMKMAAQTAVWVEDNRAALRLFLAEAERAEAPFYGRVDAEKIGALGMSFGGSVALSLTREDAIKASANLDGFYFDPAWDVPIQKPMLVTHHDQIGGFFLTYPFLNAASDAYLVTVKGTTHGNFMDYNVLIAENVKSTVEWEGEQIEVGMLGEVDPDAMEGYLNRMVVEFFAQYLLGRTAAMLDGDVGMAGVTVERKKE